MDLIDDHDVNERMVDLHDRQRLFGSWRPMACLECGPLRCRLCQGGQSSIPQPVLDALTARRTNLGGLAAPGALLDNPGNGKSLSAH